MQHGGVRWTQTTVLIKDFSVLSGYDVMESKAEQQHDAFGFAQQGKPVWKQKWDLWQVYAISAVL